MRTLAYPWMTHASRLVGLSLELYCCHLVSIVSVAYTLMLVIDLRFAQRSHTLNVKMQLLVMFQEEKVSQNNHFSRLLS